MIGICSSAHMALIPKAHIGSFSSCFYFVPVVFLYRNVPYSNILWNPLLFSLYLHNFNHNSLGAKHRDFSLSIHYLVLYAFSLDVWYKILWLHNSYILHVCNTSILWVTLRSTVKSQYIWSSIFSYSSLSVLLQFTCGNIIEDRVGKVGFWDSVFSDIFWFMI